jgi:hypothetical protein
MDKKNPLDTEGGLLGALAVHSDPRRPRTLARRVTALGVAAAVSLPALGLSAAPAMAADDLEDSSSSSASDVTATATAGEAARITVPGGPLVDLSVTRGQLADAVVLDGSTLSYTSLRAGRDSFTYTGTAADGTVRTGTVTVDVTEQPAEQAAPEAEPSPGALAGAEQPADAGAEVAGAAANDLARVLSGTSVLVDVLVNDTAVDSSTLSVVGSTTGVGAVVEDGKLRLSASRSFSGSAVVSYLVNGTDGTALSGQVDVTVTAQAADDSMTLAGVLAGGYVNPVRVSVLANDSGSFSSSGSNYQAFVLDTTGTKGSVTSPYVGNRSDGTTGPKGEPLYTPAPGFVGVDTFAYSTITTDGQVVSATVSITVLEPSVARSDSFAIAPDATTALDVLANDDRPRPGTLTVHRWPGNATFSVIDDKVVLTPTPGFVGALSFDYHFQGLDGYTRWASASVDVGPVAKDDTSAAGVYAGNVTSNDLAASSARVVLVRGPSNGSVSLTGAGDYVYTPADGFEGTDSFSYQLSSTTSGGATVLSRPATVTLRTSAALDDVVTLDAGTARALVAPVSNDVAVDPSSLQVLASPKLANIVGVNADGTVVLEVSRFYSGADSFTYSVKGTDGRTLEATVTMDVVPVAGDDDGGSYSYGSVVGNDPGYLSAKAVLRSQTSHGEVELDESGTWRYTPARNYVGPDSFTYALVTTLEDGRQLTSRVATVTFTVPVSAGYDSASVPAAGSVRIDVLANDQGSDASTLVITRAPSAGTARVEDGGIVYDAPLDASGSFDLAYEVRGTDGVVRTSGAAITVTPVGVDDAFRVGVGSTRLEVRANDRATRSDFEVSDVTFLTEPEHGTVRAPFKGEPIYTPEPGYVGVDTFVYEAYDASGRSYSATVTLDVTALDPSVTSDSAVVDSGTTTSVDVLANDVDVNASTLRITSAPEDVTAVVRNGLLEVTAPASFSGWDQLTYEVTDELGQVQGSRLDINVAPVAVADVVAPGTTTVDVLANDRGSLEDVTVVLDGPATGGTATLDGSVVSFTFAPGSTSGTLSYHLEQERPDGAPVIISAAALGTVAADGTLVSSSAPVSFSAVAVVTPPVTTPPVTTPPVVTPPAAPAAAADSTSTRAGEPVVVDVLANDAQADGATITFGTSAHGTLELVGSAVRYTPTEGFAGRDSFTYTLTRDGQSSSARVSVDVNPLTRDDSSSAASGQQVALDVLANDSVGTWDLIEVVRGPEHGTAGFADEGVDDDRLYYTPEAGFVGTDTVVYRVTVDGLTSEATVTFTVTAGLVTAPVTNPTTPTPAAVVTNPSQTRPSTSAPRATERTTTTDRGSLAYTGAETERLLLGAGVLLVLGAGLVLLGRKRFTS